MREPRRDTVSSYPKRSLLYLQQHKDSRRWVTQLRVIVRLSQHSALPLNPAATIPAIPGTGGHRNDTPPCVAVLPGIPVRRAVTAYFLPDRGSGAAGGGSLGGQVAFHTLI